MLRHRLTAIATVLIAVGALAGVPVQAHAETVTVTDPRGDGGQGRSGDIGTVRVRHGTSLVFFRVFAAEGGTIAHYYDLWVDINPADPGPERVVDWAAEVEDADVHRTGSFGVTGPQVRCQIVRQQWIREGIRIVIRRECLRRLDGTLPPRIRVSVQSSMMYGNADWAPGVRRFGPWVSSSAS